MNHAHPFADYTPAPEFDDYALVTQNLERVIRANHEPAGTTQQERTA